MKSFGRLYMVHLQLEFTLRMLKEKGLPYLLLLIIVAIFWKTTTYPFIEDDWFRLYHVATTGFLEYVIGIFSPYGKLFYRPLGHIFFLFSYYLFGLSSGAFHVLLLLLHFCNALLVSSIIYRLTRDRLLSWGTAIIYAGAVTIHAEPLSWCVGIYYLGGAFFLYLSIDFFIRSRYTLSALACLCAFLFQEGTAFLPVLLVGYAVLCRSSTSASGLSIENPAGKFRAHGLVLFIYALIKLLSQKSIPASQQDAYNVTLFGSHVVRNVFFYLKWALDAVLPVKGLPLGAMHPNSWTTGPIPLSWYIAAAFAALIVALGLAKTKFSLRSENTKTALFFCMWLFLGLGPVVFLKNHTFRYYLSYSLPALAALFILFLRSMLRYVARKNNYGAIGVAAYLACATIASGWYFYSSDAKGAGHGYIGGDNNLVKKAYAVTAVQEGLLRKYPVLPDYGLLVFEDRDVLWSFGFVAGPRLWYKNNTLMVVDKMLLKKDQKGLYIDNAKWLAGMFGKRVAHVPERVYLDPTRTFVFKIKDGELKEEGFSSLLASTDNVGG